MMLRLLLLILCLNAPLAFAADAPPTADPAKVCIVLVGDSTVAPNGGWGPGFEPLLTKEAKCINWARPGRSSISFVSEGWWTKALADKPNYVLIQFGHSDMPGKGPTRETDPKTTFPAAMAKYVDDARAAGAKPILITSLTRRLFSGGKIKSNLTEYADAVIKLAAEKKVPLIDLHARSIAALDEIGPKASEELNHVAKPKPGVPADPKDAKPDRTHLSPKGADLFGRIVADDLIKVIPELAPFVRAK